MAESSFFVVHIKYGNIAYLSEHPFRLKWTLFCKKRKKEILSVKLGNKFKTSHILIQTRKHIFPWTLILDRTNNIPGGPPAVFHIIRQPVWARGEEGEQWRCVAHLIPLLARRTATRWVAENYEITGRLPTSINSLVDVFLTQPALFSCALASSLPSSVQLGMANNLSVSFAGAMVGRSRWRRPASSR